MGGRGQPTVLATLVSSQPLYVQVDASESDLLAVRRARMARQPGAEPGQIAPGEWRPADLATADSKEFNVHGAIDYVDPALNPQTGTIRVRCRFDNPDLLLLPGLFVRVRILLDADDQIVAPDIALLTDQTGRYALVVTDKDVIEKKPVTIGALDGAMRVVTGGLTLEDRLVVNGLQRARPGVTVKPTLKELRASATTTPGRRAGRQGRGLRAHVQPVFHPPADCRVCHRDPDRHCRGRFVPDAAGGPVPGHCAPDHSSDDGLSRRQRSGCGGHGGRTY